MSELFSKKLNPINEKLESLNDSKFDKGQSSRFLNSFSISDVESDSSESLTSNENENNQTSRNNNQNKMEDSAIIGSSIESKGQIKSKNYFQDCDANVNVV